MNPKIKAVLFDLAGTLIYVKDLVGTIYSNVARSNNILNKDIKTISNLNQVFDFLSRHCKEA